MCIRDSCWSGKTSLTPEDLGLDRSQLPPETLVSLGEKQLIHPAALREFTTIRSAAHRHCLAAVSYTHLDVYKRQDWHRQYRGSGRWQRPVRRGATPERGIPGPVLGGPGLSLIHI